MIKLTTVRHQGVCEIGCRRYLEQLDVFSAVPMSNVLRDFRILNKLITNKGVTWPYSSGYGCTCTMASVEVQTDREDDGRSVISVAQHLVGRERRPPSFSWGRATPSATSEPAMEGLDPQSREKVQIVRRPCRLAVPQ